MRDTLLTYESKSMEKEREQIGGPISECMKPYFAGINDLIGRSPLTGKMWSMSVTERLLLGFTSGTWWDFNIKREYLPVLRSISHKILNYSVQSASFPREHRSGQGWAWGVHPYNHKVSIRETHSQALNTTLELLTGTSGREHDAIFHWFFFFFNGFTLNLTCRARPGSLLRWEVVINII